MQIQQHTPTKHVHLISLGCSRNRVDSEVMLGSLLEKGWKITNEPDKADSIIVNTCGFIQSAKEESVDTILSCAEHKKHNPNMKLVVTGCLTQRYKSQLKTGLPEVDFFVGTDEFSQIAELLNSDIEKGQIFAKRKNYLYSEAMPRVNTLAKHSAYVKIAEGCQHQCAFCIIPAIRGQLRSRPVASVIKEVMGLVDTGVLEVNLIAQDLAAYGREHGDTNLLELLRALVKIDGLNWARMLYMYPENISKEFLDFFAGESKLVKYLDIPMQHASDKILKSMKRDVNQDGLVNTMKNVRNHIPDIAIRTSVMVGYPGETEDDFQQLLGFVKEQRFDHLGCFSYSQEEGTVAARLPDQIDDQIKQNRLDQIMTVQKQISMENLKKYVGKTLPILVKGPSDDSDLVWEGRLYSQAPEVDGVVFINDGPVKAHSIQTVKITDSYEYDLVGHVVDSP